MSPAAKTPGTDVAIDPPSTVIRPRSSVATPSKLTWTCISTVPVFESTPKTMDSPDCSTGAEPGRFSFPAGIAAHPDGRVAVVDSFNLRLQIFGPPETGDTDDGTPVR